VSGIRRVVLRIRRKCERAANIRFDSYNEVEYNNIAKNERVLRGELMSEGQKCIKCNGPKDVPGASPYCSKCTIELGFRPAGRLPVEIIDGRRPGAGKDRIS
jgi:hypothetical protein